MKDKVKPAQKDVASDALGKPKSSRQFRLIKIRSDLYFRLLDLKERRRGRCSFNRVISDLLNYYIKMKDGKNAD
jgi:hypothetical protein